MADLTTDSLKEMIKKYQMKQEQIDPFMRMMGQKMGDRIIRRVKKATPVGISGSGGMRYMWSKTPTEKYGNTYLVNIINPVDYASHVEDGHMQHRRFVPGYWEGNEFHYTAYTGQGPREKGDNYKGGGMMLTDRFIPGQHMLRNSIAQVKELMPKVFEKEMEEFLKL